MELVEARILEADGERGYGLRGGAAHEARDGARVDAGAEPRADGNVAPQVEPHRFLELRAELRRPGVGRAARRAVAGIGEAQLPVRMLGQDAPLVEHVVARQHLTDGAEEGARREDEAEGQEVLQRADVEPALDPAGDEQRLQLGAEEQALGRLGVVRAA